MANFQPFKAFRPKKDELDQIAIKSSDFDSKKALIAEIEANELAYLNLTNAHYLSKTENQPEKAFEHAHNYVQAMFDEGHFVEDQEACYYIYRQTSLQRACTGIIGKADIEEYDNNTIKKHELTRTNSEHLIADLFRATRVLGEPVLLGYPANEAIESVIQEIVQGEADEVFNSRLGGKHELWMVKEEAIQDLISRHIAEIDSLYIMDGHHRMAALSNLHSFKPEEKGRYFMANLVADTELHIGPFHRKVLNIEMDEKDLLLELSHIFDIQNFGTDLKIYNPGQRNEFGMLLNDNWYSLRLRNPHHTLDVTILESEVLAPIFDIFHTQTDPRVEFVKNIEEMEVIEEMKGQKDSVLFTLFPCSFDEIKTISEQGGTMPPKSTYIQPRSRPGMVIQKFL